MNSAKSSDVYSLLTRLTTDGRTDGSATSIAGVQYVTLAENEPVINEQQTAICQGVRSLLNHQTNPQLLLQAHVGRIASSFDSKALIHPQKAYSVGKTILPAFCDLRLVILQAYVRTAQQSSRPSTGTCHSRRPRGSLSPTDDLHYVYNTTSTSGRLQQ